MKLALFDFDETLICQNSLGLLFKEVTGKKVLFPEALSLFFDVNTYRHGVKTAIKRRLYQRCLVGASENDLYEAGKIASGKLQQLDKVVACLHDLHKQNHTIWIVTATPTAFVKGIVEQWGWPVERVIGTELYIQNNVYTGQFGQECMEGEKIKRINEVINIENLNATIEVAYGNLPVDKPMMSLAKISYAVTGKKVVKF